MAQLDALQVYQLVDKQSGGKASAGELVATAIVMRESSGVTNARNTNADGSIDRGLWQWNNRAHPDITDADADNPEKATALAYAKSAHWTNFGPWLLGPKQRAAYAKAGVKLVSVGFGVEIPEAVWNDTKAKVLSASNASIHTGPQDGILGAVGGAIPGVNALGKAVDGVVGGFSSWTDALRYVLNHLTSAGWWKRLGIGAAGIALVIGALVLVAGSSGVGSKVAGAAALAA